MKNEIIDLLIPDFTGDDRKELRKTKIYISLRDSDQFRDIETEEVLDSVDGRNIHYLGKVRGKVQGLNLERTLDQVFFSRLAPLLIETENLNLPKNLEVLRWVRKARDMYKDLNHWTGIYYKASFALSEDSTDLILGPYIGAPTDHVRIPIDKGLCGLALKEEKVINIGDVKENPLYLACSLETKSEIVIPIKGPDDSFIAELDIDGHIANSFAPHIEEKLTSYCDTFVEIFRK